MRASRNDKGSVKWHNNFCTFLCCKAFWSWQCGNCVEMQKKLHSTNLRVKSYHIHNVNGIEASSNQVPYAAQVYHRGQHLPLIFLTSRALFLCGCFSHRTIQLENIMNLIVLFLCFRGTYPEIATWICHQNHEEKYQFEISYLPDSIKRTSNLITLWGRCVGSL